MVSNIIIQNILNVINSATPGKCRITTSAFKNTEDHHIIIYNCKEDHVSITIWKTEDKNYCTIRTSTGINFYSNLEQLEYLNIQTAIIECINRFNETINEFCENFL